jgi:hypothetical protein
VAKIVTRRLAGDQKGLLAMRQQLDDSGTANACSTLVTLLQEISEELVNNPASQLVGRLAGQVKNTTAAAAISCSAADFDALQAANSEIDKFEVELDEELTAVQDTLQGETIGHI